MLIVIAAEADWNGMLRIVSPPILTWPLKGLGVDPGIVDLVERDIHRVSPVNVRPLGVVPEPVPGLVGGLVGLESIQGQFRLMKPVGIHLRFIHILVPRMTVSVLIELATAVCWL